MILALERRWLTEVATVGELRVDGEMCCWTLEDTYRPPPEPKVLGKTCIPNGRYEVVVTHSPRFSAMAGVPVDMPLLLNVPGFTGVRIHWGNTAEDTDGCILVGLDRGPNQVLRSRLAYEKLFPLIQAARAKGELVHINITTDAEEITNAGIKPR